MCWVCLWLVLSVLFSVPLLLASMKCPQSQETNATGDDQKKLDVLSNDIFVNTLTNSGCAPRGVPVVNDEATPRRVEAF